MSAVIDFLKGLFSIIPKLLYFIVACVLSLIDLCQVAFRKLAGLDPIVIEIAGNEELYTGDVTYKIIIDALFKGKYPAISTVFWALIILGVFMLFITSFIALLRLEYNPDKEKGNSKSGVVKNFFKAIFSFAIIPISCFFGMYLFNALVGILDSATSIAIMPDSEIAKCYDKWNAVQDSNNDSFAYGGETLTTREDAYMAYEIFGIHIPTTSQPFSGMVFKACAYGSNRMRNDKNYYTALYNDNTLGFMHDFANSLQAANIIDTGFAINAKLKGTFNLNQNISKEFFNDCADINIGSWKYNGITSLSKYNVNAVFYFYDLWSFNYIIAFIAVISIGKTYYNFLLYLMQRVFEILGLFFVSPIAVSLMPLDNGESLKSWRQIFITKFVLLVIMVGTLNLITPFIAVCQNIKFFDIPVIDYILLTFFIIAAFNAVDSLNKLFSKIFTGDAKNFNAVGEAGDKITGNFQQGLNKTMSAARIAAKPVTIPMGMAGRGISIAGQTAFRNWASNRQENINSRLNGQQRAADNTLNTELQKIENEAEGLKGELNGVNQDEQRLNAFNNQTGGFLERNDANDDKMLKAYKKSHFVGKRNDSAEVQEHLNKLKTDDAYRQKVLDEAYKKENDKRFASFYQDDNNLSQAENATRRSQMYDMLKQGQTGLDDRRADIATRQALFNTTRDERIETANRIHDLETSRIQRKREAPERRVATIGKLTNKANKAINRFSGDVANLANSVPIANLISSSAKDIHGKK